MSERRGNDDVVYLPRQPGPLVRPNALANPPDEVDEVLDDLFGADDATGPSATDAVLVAAGIGAIIAGQIADLPGLVTVLGVALVGLGVILPIRATARRLGERKGRARLMSAVGNQLPLRQDDELLRRLATLHDSVISGSERLVEAPRSRATAVAHALVDEVVTLLAGELPASAAELEYVQARIVALEDLARTIDDDRIGDGDAIGRRARTEARLEVERLSGRSALHESAELVAELRPDDDAAD